MPGLYDDLLADLDAIPLAPAPPQKPQARRLLESPRTPAPPAVSLADARRTLFDRMWAYASARFVTGKFLGAPPPGVGKTFAAVAVAERAAFAGMRVAYVMPRHDFFDDILAASVAQGGRPDLWFHWLPRQEGERYGGAGNCHWAGAIHTWASRGNASMKFCAAVCGHDYIKGGSSGLDGCAYHQQERAALAPIDDIPRIVAIQHNHIVTNHPVLKRCDLVIGDESPLMSFCHAWHLPPAAFQHEQPDMAATAEDMALYALSLRLGRAIQAIGQDDEGLTGAALYDALGGPGRLLALLAACPTDDRKGIAPDVNQMDATPWQWHPHLVPLMQRECKAIQAGDPWMPRLRLDASGAHVLLKRQLSKDLPAKIIWLDATANVDMYRSVTSWPIEVYAPRVVIPGPVYQVFDTLNTKATAMTDDGVSERTRERVRVVQEISAAHGYVRPLVVTYQALVAEFERAGFVATHFYANRGTNAYQDCDAVFVYGTPQLPHGAIERAGQMLYFDRMAPFSMAYRDQPTPYAGQPWAYPTPGYWDEPQIHALLRMLREDEIEQSAHRIRPVSAPKAVWLLTGIPVANVPPTKLLSTLEALIVHLPPGRQRELRGMRLDAVRLCDAIDVATAEIASRGYVTHRELMACMQLDDRTARKYVQALRMFDPARFGAVDLEAAGIS